MMFYRFSPWLKGLFVVLLAGTGLRAAAPTEAAPSDAGRLVLVAEHGIEAVETTGAAHDFGTIDALGSTQLEQTFHLRNAGSEPVLINYIQPSCGCASAVLSSEGGGDANTIAPGAQVAVRVTVDVAHLHPGHIDKYAMIYVKGNIRPAFTLEVRGELLPLIGYRPRVLNFDRINAGMGNEQTLVVTLDRRVLTGKVLPELICTNPDVEVKLLSESSPAIGTQPNQNTVVRTYSVTLSRQARLGTLSGAIAFVPAASKSVQSRRTPFGQAALISDAIGGESVVLSGEIVGKFYDMPYVVFFGSVSQGEEATRQVKLIGLTPDILSGLSVSCSVPTLTARLVAPAAQAGAVGPLKPTVMLEIKLNNQTPVGGLSGEVIVIAKDGERLVIPIVGDVIKEGIKTAAH